MRLSKGELLIDSLTAFTKEKNLPAAWVSGIGGSLWVELGYYHLDARVYDWQRTDDELEITNLQGTIAWSEKGEPFPHIHGSFASADFQGFGGHIKELAVSGTCELVIRPWHGSKIIRKQDSEVGLYLLDV
jgi:uncharacterized protein